MQSLLVQPSTSLLELKALTVTKDEKVKSSQLVRDLRVLDSIASWCGALHESMPLGDAIGSLAQAISADLAILSRDARSDGKCRIVADYDSCKSNRDLEQLRRAFAPDILGGYYGKMRRGSTWFLSDHEDNAEFQHSSALASWRLVRGVVDIVVVALETTGMQNDFLEFHFSNELSRADKEELKSLLPTLVRAWSGRKRGLVTKAHIDDRILQARTAAQANKTIPDAPILGLSNPAKLSRAEFRVCLLVSRGLSIKGATEELSLSEATIRSHLRSIYAKTGTNGLPDLVYRILSSDAEIMPVSERRSK